MGKHDAEEQTELRKAMMNRVADGIEWASDRGEPRPEKEAQDMTQAELGLRSDERLQLRIVYGNLRSKATIMCFQASSQKFSADAVFSSV